jgi:hypothetical protein
VYSHGDAWRFECSDESDERQRCLSITNQLPLILHPDAPVSFYFPSLFTSALPLLPATLNSPLLKLKKKKSKKTHLPIRVPHFCFQSSTQLSLASHSSYYQHLRSAYLALLSVTYLITLLQQLLAFVMGDNATEIDLDSVIDRLLEGAFFLLRSRNIFYGYKSRRFSISPV